MNPDATSIKMTQCDAAGRSSCDRHRDLPCCRVGGSTLDLDVGQLGVSALSGTVLQWRWPPG